MPEALSSIERLKTVIEQNNLSPEILREPSHSIEQSAHIKVDSLSRNDQGHETDPLILTASEVSRRLQASIAEAKGQAQETARYSLRSWESLGETAEANLGIEPSSANKQAEGRVKAESVLRKHERHEEHGYEVAGQIIDHMNTDRTKSYTNLLQVDWQPDAQAAGIDVSKVTKADLKNLPEFQGYRQRLIAKVVELDRGSQVDWNKSLDNPGEFLQGVWNRVSQNFKLAGSGTGAFFREDA